MEFSASQQQSGGAPDPILRRIALLGGAVPTAIGILGLAGWLLHGHALTSLRQLYLPPSPGACFAFLLQGPVLIRIAFHPSPGRQWPFTVPAALSAILGMLACVGFFANPDLTLGREFLPSGANAMSPVTGAVVFLSGTALVLLLRGETGKWGPNLIDALALLVAATGLIGIISQVYGTPLLYGRAIMPPALATAIAFAFLSAGLLAAAGTHGYLLGRLRGDSVRAVLLRTFIPMGFIAVIGSDILQHLITGLNSSLVSGASVVFFGAITIAFVTRAAKRIGGTVDRAEAERKLFETNLLEQKDFLQNFIQNSAVPTFVLDDEHRVIIWNRACEEMTGLKAADMIGTDNQWMAFYDHKRPLLADIVMNGNAGELDRLYLTHGKSLFIPEGLQAERWCANLNGRERYILFNAAPIRNRKGELIAVIQTLDDLTAVKTTEKTLRESEERYRGLFEKSPAVMLVISPDSLEISDANSTACAFYGYARKEIVGKKVTEICMLPADAIIENLQTAMQNPGHMQCAHRLSDGSVRDVEVCQGPIDIHGRSFVFSIVYDITARKEAEEALRQSENKLRAITQTTTDAIILLDDEKKISYWNRAAEQMFGFDHSEALESDIEIIIPPRFRETHKKAFARFSKTDQGQMIGEIFEASALRKDGTEFPVEISISGFLLKGKWHSAGVIRDITQRKNLENQLRHAQKMEAIGTLAGGIAHDFNNILSAIIGYGNLAEMKIGQGGQGVEDIRHVLASADRAVHLTQSLLAFSRKKSIETKPVDLNDIVEKVEKLLLRLLRENIEFKTVLTEDDLTIMADGGQIEQILINLATNARDAMPMGGALRIHTSVVELDMEFVKAHGYGAPGRYALLSLSDTGSGMDKETVQKIFEPFFTTKDIGRGTGLGLAIVYGIVKQHNGFINCYSEPGQGAIFRIYLPLSGAAARKESDRSATPVVGGTETILIAEDDSVTRALDREILKTFGYEVIEASDGEEAIAKFIEHQDRIDMVFMDVIMPKKNGKEVYEQIRKLRPNVRALFTSGYPMDVLDEEELAKSNFLPKPIIPYRLLEKIREILDREESAPR